MSDNKKEVVVAHINMADPVKTSFVISESLRLLQEAQHTSSDMAEILDKDGNDPKLVSMVGLVMGEMANGIRVAIIKILKEAGEPADMDNPAIREAIKKAEEEGASKECVCDECRAKRKDQAAAIAPAAKGFKFQVPGSGQVH